MQKIIGLCLLLLLQLGVQDGYLALKDSNGNSYIFPYKAELYTQTDQALLEKGIPLPNRESLSAVLEDYFS